MSPLFAQGIDPAVLGFVVGLIVAWTVGLAVGALIGGFLLRTATRLICNIDLPYVNAVGYFFVTSFIAADFGIIVRVLFEGMGATATAPDGNPTALIKLITFLLTFLFCSLFYGSVITDLRRRPIGFGNGALITLGVFVAFIIILLLLLALIIGAMLMFGHVT